MQISDEFLKEEWCRSEANLHVFYTFNMSRITHALTFWLCLAIMFQEGFSLRLADQESAFFDEVSRELPMAECDMIVVSSSPLKGELHKIFRIFNMKVLYMTRNYHEMCERSKLEKT